jgi:hypothetical protein
MGNGIDKGLKTVKLLVEVSCSPQYTVQCTVPVCYIVVILSIFPLLTL